MTKLVMCFVSLIQKLLNECWYVKTMPSVMPFTFNGVDLHVVTANEKSWTRAREVCKGLTWSKKTVHVIKGHYNLDNITQKHLRRVSDTGAPLN